MQSEASHWILYEHLAFELPSLVVSFLYGFLSDHVSRKIALILPIIGQVLCMSNYIIQSVYIDAHIGFLLIGRVISGVFGGWISCCLASFSFISQITSPDNRTVRISIAEGCISFAIALSVFISGMLLNR